LLLYQKFTAGKRILKIGYLLAKLEAKVGYTPFSGHDVEIHENRMNIEFA